MLSTDHIFIFHSLNYIQIRRKTKTGDGDCEFQHEGATHGAYIFEH